MKKILYFLIVQIFIMLASYLVIGWLDVSIWNSDFKTQDMVYEESNAEIEENLSLMEQEKQGSLVEPEETDSEEKLQENYTILVSNSMHIDEEFAAWLYENYTDDFENVMESIKKDAYTDSLWYDLTGKSIFVLKDEKNGIFASEETMKAHLIYQKKCNDLDYVNLLFAGDVSFANDYLPSQNYTSMGIDGAFSEELQNTMQEADIFMINNEFCYSTRGNPIPKGYNFRADPSRVKRLDEMGVDIVSIANNHAYDYGAEAFLDTIDTLKEDDMPYVGGGSDLADAKNHIVYFIANGIKIGYIAATQIERDTVFTQPATEDSPGVVRCYDPELVNEMIAEAKQNCDFVIVYPHWGTELVKEIQNDQQELAYSFIDAGADAVIGGHPHCLQGVEYYKHTPIFYSLSNFSFSGKVVDSTVLNLKVTIDGIQQAKYVPCMEQSGKTHQCDMGDGDYERIIDLLNNISANAQIDENGVVTEK